MPIRPGAVRGARYRATGIAVAVALAVGALTVPTHAASARNEPATDPAQAVLENIVQAGTPGVAATARRGEETWQGAAGLADLETGRERANNDHFRAASITKTFVATVLLQLEGEGELSLDDSVEKWLPGLVRGNGNDGNAITVRQLLQHTSGLVDYTSDEEFARKHFVNFFDHRYDHYEPTDLVAIAMRYEPDFAPGTNWRYSNTGYVIAGMVIEAVTGKHYAKEVRKRLLNPLRMKGTSLPGGKVGLPRPHAVGYAALDPAAEDALSDVTNFSPTIADASGEIISTEKDLNRFYRALARGELLPKAQQKAMFDTVPVAGGGGARYGLGIISRPLPCGITVWGHSGGIPGSASEVFATKDGNRLLSVNANGVLHDGRATVRLAEVEFCGVDPNTREEGANSPEDQTGRGEALSPNAAATRK